MLDLTISSTPELVTEVLTETVAVAEPVPSAVVELPGDTLMIESAPPPEVIEVS